MYTYYNYPCWARPPNPVSHNSRSDLVQLHTLQQVPETWFARAINFVAVTDERKFGSFISGSSILVSEILQLALSFDELKFGSFLSG